MEIKPRLEVELVKYKYPQECDYCFKRFSELKYFVTNNREILDFFRKPSTSRHSRRGIRLCQTCFTKLHSTLEEIENEGWQTLEESDYE
jgi:hypothetical protein